MGPNQMVKGDELMSKWKKGYRQTPEARAATNRTRTELVIKRYWYVINVLGEPAWKARMARSSVSDLTAMFPNHDFPQELVARKKPGPRPGAVYRKKATNAE
jgi:hypothetical protein